MSDDQKKRSPTISDVAKEAGVSTSTVSRALSRKIPVHPSTMTRIEAAVAKLNYQPSVLARGLKEGSSRTLGLIVPDITNPVFPAVALGAESEALSQGYQVFLAHSHEDSVLESQLIKLMLQRKVDGLLIASAAEGFCREKWLQLPVPVIQLIRKFDDQLPYAICDQDQIGQLAASHLAMRGYQRPVIITGNQALPLYRQRKDSFIRTLLRAGYSSDAITVLDGSQWRNEGLGMVQSVIASKTDAVFASCDMQALGIARGLLAANIKIPGDVAIIGMDNLALCHLMTPAITSIRQPLKDLGKKAMSSLLSMIRDQSAETHIKVSCWLNPGETT